VALLVIAVVVGILFRGAGEPDAPNVAMLLAKKQLTEQVEGLMGAGEFDAAAGKIGKFLDKYPDASGLPRLWTLKIVCHRKAGDVGSALMAVDELDDACQGRGRELCDAGVILVRKECYSDAAKVFDLAFKRASGDTSIYEQGCYPAAICNYRIGRFARAMQYIDAAAALNPNDPKITAAMKRIEDARFVADE